MTFNQYLLLWFLGCNKSHAIVNQLSLHNSSLPYLAKKHYADGLQQAVLQIGELMRQYYAKCHQDGDLPGNELSNRPYLL